MFSKTRIVIAAVAAALLTACGGGGGGTAASNSNTPTTPTAPTTPSASYTISGTVVSPSGTPIQGVQISLSGAETGTTISNSNGAFSFTGASNGNYTLAASAAGMTFTPSTQSISVAGAASSGVNFSRTYASTPQIVNYIDTRHSSVQTAFLATAEPTAQKHAALGSLRGGNHVAESINNYLSTVQSFLNDCIANASALNVTLPVDSEKIAALLRTYQAQDVNYVATYYGNWAFGTLSASVISDAKARVDSAYDAAIANLP